MKKMNCIAIDDEPLALDVIEDYIKKVDFLNLVKKCNKALGAIDLLQTETVDLMFLDIQMPDLTGIDFLKSLKKKPVVIFTTAYPEYALDGYSLGVIDYLLKPISFERFFQSVNKAIEQINLLKRKQNDEKAAFIMIKSEHRIHKVNFENILYIEGLKEYVTFHLKKGKRIITLKSLKSLEELLPNNFMRIHRSYIVNKNEVISLYRNMIEIGDKKIDIGKTFKEKVIAEFLNEK